jgi:hypothetical protein
MQQEHLKVAGDVLSVSTVIAALMSWLPPIAALLTIVWTLMRIVDEWPNFSKKLRKFLNRLKGG